MYRKYATAYMMRFAVMTGSGAAFHKHLAVAAVTWWWEVQQVTL
jgi:hypothetical protein